LRICMLTTCYPLAQADITCSFVHRLAKALVKAGEQVMVLAPGAPNAKAQECMDGVEVHRFTYVWPRSWQQLAYRWGIPENLKSNKLLYCLIPPFFLFFALQAIRLCRSADIIHAHWLPAGLVALIVGKLLGKPSVVTVHGSDARLLPSFVSRYIVRGIGQVHVVSIEMQEIIHALGREGHLIPILVDEDTFNPEVDPTPAIKEFGLKGDVVTFVGRLNEFRNPLALVRAMPYVLERHPDVYFVIIGDGPLAHEITELAERLGVRDHLVMTGARNDVHRFLKASSAFLALSQVDNVWTCAIAEAMLVGVPCIMTAAGFTGRFFTHGQNCYIVPVDDDQALAEAILTLLGDRSLARRLVEGANRLLIEKGRRDALVIKDMLTLYQAAMPKSSDPKA